MIQKTKDYDIFKKNLHNRDTCESNMRKLIRSIQTKNMLSFRPILVNEKMEVIDGQHRLEAAKRLDLEIYYQLEPSIQTEDMIRLNQCAKIWKREDYLNYYCNDQLEEYLKLKTFMCKHKLSVSMSLVILGQSGGGGVKKESQQNLHERFKSGKYVFPAKVEEIEVAKILLQSEEIIKYLIPKMEGNKSFLSGPKFRRALYIFLSIGALDFDVLMNKLAIRVDLMRPCASISDFVKLFKRIYNYNNRNPIHIDENERA